ncbi:hypothetical protein HOU00_gp365 [Caulobacter phage CcrPW]|uniref:Uncharacterized protein n=1 Tax=Caulobacter phage CcrPW TaxID=2283271 RepID=A0A385EAR3_9CAUD|nr:hypothetical protein HOU00_gp365 [Caulobacter phage CcrPW]AXQ68760.1 hypothetical protein CcrPW_gp221c [Caulobacter phage CcrPW]
MPTPLIIVGVLLIAVFLIWGVSKLQSLDDQHDRRGARRVGSGGSGAGDSGGFFLFADAGGGWSSGGGHSGGSCSGGGDAGSCDGGGGGD